MEYLRGVPHSRVFLTNPGTFDDKARHSYCSVACDASNDTSLEAHLFRHNCCKS